MSVNVAPPVACTVLTPEHGVGARAARSAWAPTTLSGGSARPSASPSTASGSTAPGDRTASSSTSSKATGHVTLAETPPDPADYPGALPDMLYTGSLVFVQPRAPRRPARLSNWWKFMRGADWRHPYGPESTINGLRAIIRWCTSRIADAEAYARWAGKDAADRGGVGIRRARRPRRRDYAWGDEFTPGGDTWPTPGRANFRGENLQRGRLRRHVARRLRSRPTATACTT